MELIAVAAVDDTLAIGLDGELPWESLPDDKRQYRERITGYPVILGRRTFESMLDDLPGRRQIVLSREAYEPPVESAVHARDVVEAIELAHRFGDDAVYVLGGAVIYELFMPHLDRMFLSRVPGEHEADTYFPVWDCDHWRRIRSVDRTGFTLEEWVRVAGGPSLEESE